MPVVKARRGVPHFRSGSSWRLLSHHFARITGVEVQSWDMTLARFDDLARASNPNRREGFGPRIADAFPEAEMPRRMGKDVRSASHRMKSERTARRNTPPRPLAAPRRYR